MKSMTFELLRHVNLDFGYTLKLYDTGDNFSDPYSRPRLAYEMFAPDGSVLFSGDDFFCSPLNSIDGDDALRGLLGFLTLQPGDVESDYFDDYTPEQLAFAEGDAEQLSILSLDSDGEYPAHVFEDIE